MYKAKDSHYNEKVNGDSRRTKTAPQYIETMSH